MKTNYFTKVENKYVFNVSLIFWHILIALATLAIVVSLLVFLWGAIPASHKKVVKSPYPEKKEYPAQIKVTLAELNLNDLQKEEFPEIDEKVAVAQPKEPKPLEDLTGKIEYEASLDTLKILIPPTKYSWEGQGYWHYPQGKRFWDVHKREIYRRWITTEGGITDKLNTSYRRANAKNFIEKKQLLDGYIKIIKLFPENIRLNTLQIIIGNVASNVQRNNDILNSLVNVVKNMDKTESIDIIDLLTYFGKDNPNDGIPFINYVSTIIDKFDKTQQNECVKTLISSFNDRRLFSQNLTNQIEATDFYIPLLSQMKLDQQAKALFPYYNIYLGKKQKRKDQIEQIEFEHQQAIDVVDSKFSLAQQQAQMDFEAKKAKKERLRLRALSGIGGGIILVVLIATFLAFLSIQRSVRKMEEKMINSKD